MAKAKAKPVEDDDDDDLLAGKADKKAKAKPAKKVAAKANGKAKPKKASAEEVDELLASKKGNGKAKPGKPAKPAAKREVSPPAEDIADSDDVRKALLKARKATSYKDIHEATGFNIRQIRRTARVMRDNGELVFTKQGTEVLVQRA